MPWSPLASYNESYIDQIPCLAGICISDWNTLLTSRANLIVFYLHITFCLRQCLFLFPDSPSKLLPGELAPCQATTGQGKFFLSMLKIALF